MESNIGNAIVIVGALFVGVMYPDLLTDIVCGLLILFAVYTWTSIDDTRTNKNWLVYDRKAEAELRVLEAQKDFYKAKAEYYQSQKMK